MNRVLLIVNALLALFLFVRALQSPVVAATNPVALAADAMLVEPRYGSDGRATELVVHFGADLGPTQTAGEPLELGLRLDPPRPVLTAWRTPRSLAVLPATPLPRAGRYSLVFAQELANGGHRVAAGTVVPFTTPPIQLLQVLVGGEGRAQATLTAVFDLPITREMARKCLRLRHADGGHAPLACAVELPPGVAASTTATLVPNGAEDWSDHVELVVGAELRPAGADVPLGRELVQRVRLQQPLRVQEVVAADGRLEIALNRSVSEWEASTLRVEPAIAFQVQSSDRGLRLLGEFAPGSVVHVELSADFPGRGEHRLGTAARRSVLMPDRRPQLEFAQGGSVLCASAIGKLAITGCNVTAPRLRLQRVYPNNLVRALQRHDDATLAPAEAVPIPGEAARNERWTREIDLVAAAGGPLRGLYRVELLDAGSVWYPERRWLQVTDLGITWRAGRESAVVQVVDLVHGGPVVGAVVTVQTPTNQELVRGTTDAQGLLTLAWRSATADQVPFLVLAQRGEDVAFVATDAGVELADDGLGGRAYLGDRAEAWVWPSRGIARPGETLDVVALVRDARGLPLPGLPVVARFVMPNRRVAARQAMVLPGSGLLAAQLPLPLDAPTGTWWVEVATGKGSPLGEDVTLGSGSFRVEAFVPDRLEVEVVSVSPLRFGGLGTVAVRGRWLDGAPAAGRRVTARVRLLAHALQFPAAPDFTFASGMNEPPPGELPAVEGELDAAGMARLEFPLPADAAQQGLLANVAIELQDPSGRVVRAGSTAPVQRADLHLGVRAGSQRCELRVLDGEGLPLLTEQRATVRLEQREWAWRYQRSGADRWRWRTELVRTTLGEWNVTVRSGAASVDLPPSDDAYVVVTLAGRVVEQALGAVAARPDRLRVQGPAEPVAAGGPLRLLVTSPAAGRGLVTFESDRVHGACVVELQRGDTQLDVALPAGLVLPNVHAVVTLTRPAPKSGPDLGPAWLVGGAPIRLARRELQLPVTLSAPSHLQPDDEWCGTVNAPGATTALVALVDEGVLRITGHADPDPVAFLLATRALATRGADTSASLLQKMQFAAGAKTGGDGDEDLAGGLLVGSIDNRIRPYVRFARVDLDREGRGDARFPLDGYEGRVRAMVVAAGPVAVGAVSAATVVKAPLGVQVATPRMVAPGDSFLLPVTLRNSLPGGTVSLDVTAAGALQIDGEFVLQLPLAQDAETTLEVPVTAMEPAPGESLARLQVRARLGAIERTVAVEFTVRARTLWRSESIGIDLAAGGELQVGDGWQQVEATVRLDTRADPQLAPVLQRLLDYPFGCAEQTTGKALAVLASRTLLPRWFGAQDPRALTAASLVENAVQRLLMMQTWQGGFGWWPGSDDDVPFVTAYVVDFLLAAREQGIEVGATELDAALDRCAEWLRRSDATALRCQLVELLARAGRPIQPWLDWLCANALGVDDRMRLAAVLGRLGQRERAIALLGDDAETALRLPASGDLASPLRTQALRLRAWLAVDPQHERLPRLARALQRAILASTRATTQENTHCLRALADYYRLQPAPQGEPRGVVRVGGQAIALGDAVRTLPVAAGARLQFASGGSGFALVELRGLHRVADAPRQEQLALSRTLVDVDTGLPVTRLRRGGLYELRIAVDAAAPLLQLAVVDLLPGGLEAEPATAAPPTAKEAATDRPLLKPDGLERRDDRVLFFCDRVGLRSELRHRVRATLPGTYEWPAIRGEAMYDPDVYCVGTADAPLAIDP